MKLNLTWAEILETRLRELCFALVEIEALIVSLEAEKKKYKSFDFKKEGLKMTAVEFFKNQDAIKRMIAGLKKRRREILKGGKNRGN